MYGMQDRPVSWDYSNILGSNQAGAIWGRGMEQAANSFATAIQAYGEKRDRQKKEEATIGWLESNRDVVNKLFPQLAQVQDPAERRKVIKAGIKGAGLENLVQVQGYMEQQRQAQAQEAAAAEMQKLQRERMQREAAEGRARMEEIATLNQRADSALNMADQLGRGVGRGVLRPEMAQDIESFASSQAGQFRRMGGRITPEMAAEASAQRPGAGLQFVEDPVSGERFAMGNKGNFASSGRNPTKGGTSGRDNSNFLAVVRELDAAGTWDKAEDARTEREKKLLQQLERMNAPRSGGGPDLAGLLGDEDEPGAPTAGETKAAKTAAPKTIKSEAEFEALKKGTRFIWKGRTGVKQ